MTPLAPRRRWPDFHPNPHSASSPRAPAATSRAAGARVDEFVERHFSFAGSFSMHRKAIGWDMLKAPANIALAVPLIAAKLAAAGAKAVGADRASAYLASRKLVFDTEVGNEIEWLIITDLLELPFRQGERVSLKDALADTILSAPESRSA